LQALNGMDAKIEIMNKLKEMATELGRAPLRHEFTAAHFTKDHIAKHWGSFTILLQAAGLGGEVGKPRKKLTKEDVFGVSIEETLDQYEPVKYQSKKSQSTILVIGDTHFPFINKDCLEAIYSFNKENTPDYIVQVGDLYDLYAHSKFPRSQNIYKPEEEEQLARRGAVDMWARLKLDNPDAQCFQLWGNHDLRPAKRVLESLPTLEHVVKEYYKQLMSFDGVTTIEDYRQELIIDGIIFHHGYRSNLGAHRDYVLRSFVCGHSHKGGVVYKRLRDEVIWELNAGFVGDADSKALAYTAQKIHDQTLGWGFIDKHGPRFIHF
jgi:predicted phosphodiesterase